MCVLYVSFGRCVKRPRIFGCVAMGSVVFVYFSSRLHRMCVVCMCGCYRGGIVVMDVIWHPLCVGMI